MKLWRPRICNCLIWVVVMRLRYGGSMRAVGSIYGWWPHWLWYFEDGIYEYAPPVHEHDRRWPPLIFRGCTQEVIGESITRIVRRGRDVVAERINRLEVAPDEF